MSVLREAVRLQVVALQFLTRLPVPEVTHRPGDLRRAAGAFPVVGLLVGGIGVGVRVAAGALFTPVVATILAVGAMVGVTGAFHEDGLADSADGLWGGWSAPQRLEIMRDSRLGTYGVSVLVLTLALRVALLAGLPVGAFARAVVVGHVLGRASTLLAVRLAAPLPDSRAAELSRGVPARGLIVAAGTVAVTTGWALGPAALAVLLLAALLTWSGARLCERRVGGLGGDTLGAINQVVHLTTLAAAAALHDASWLPD